MFILQVYLYYMTCACQLSTFHPCFSETTIKATSAPLTSTNSHYRIGITTIGKIIIIKALYGEMPFIQSMWWHDKDHSISMISFTATMKKPSLFFHQYKTRWPSDKRRLRLKWDEDSLFLQNIPFFPFFSYFSRNTLSVFFL